MHNIQGYFLRNMIIIQGYFLRFLKIIQGNIGY